MAELRINPFTKEEVFIFPESSKKPYFFEKEEHFNAADVVDRCPFEVERAEMAERHLRTAPTGTSLGDALHWVIPNKFPLFSDDYELLQKGEDVEAIPAHGAGYLFISKSHHEVYGKLPLEHIKEMVKLQVLFMRDAVDLHPNVAYWQYFRNVGKGAGASVVHPHSQLVGLPIVPSVVRAYQQGFAEHTTCLMCSLLEQERALNYRVVGENAEFLAFAPAWSTARAQVWIVPKVHQHFMRAMTETQIVCFVELLSAVSKSYYRVFGELDYNEYLIQTSERHEGIFHWFFVLHPRTHAGAGFELATGIQGTDYLPENVPSFLGLVL